MLVTTCMNIINSTFVEGSYIRITLSQKKYIFFVSYMQ